MSASEQTVADETSAAKAALHRPLVQGDVVGRYVILTRLGAGGMGVVFAAYDPELDRKVALKLLLPQASGSSSTSEGRQRLVREAQSMARLAHPNVITVHDVGEHGGRVFIAMEFVDGDTLTEWLESVNHPWREITEAFRRAGRGLSAAHEAGLVHRDFKPDNVMIAKDGRVRVMDFGLARATGQPDAVNHEAPRPKPADLTRTGAIVGTPVYMAPEQHLGLQTDARTDQFSFCVALYEALYRERPFAGDTLSALSFNVTQGTIREPPAKTSVPAWLRRVLVRGLSLEPDRRFASMRALTDQLGRDPAAARRRWIVRLGTATALAGTVALASFVSTNPSEVCKGAEAKLSGVWDDGAKATIKAAIVSHTSADQWESLQTRVDRYVADWVEAHVEACEATELRREQSPEMMDLRIGCLDGRLRDLAALMSVFSSADAQTLQSAHDAVLRLPILQPCAEPSYLESQVKPPEDPEIAETVEALRVRIAKVKALWQTGHEDEAVDEGQAVVDALGDLDYVPIHAEAHARLGAAVTKLGEPARAREHLVHAYFLAGGTRHDEVAAQAATVLVEVVGVHQARPDEGLRWGRHALMELKRMGGHVEVEADANDRIGRVLRSLGRYQEALVHHRRAVERWTKLHGADYPTVAASLNDVGAALRNLGEQDEAIASFRQALEIWERFMGPDHRGVAAVLNNLGNALGQTGDTAGSIEAHRRALEIRQRAFGPRHPEVGISHLNLGAAYDQGKQIDRAAEHYREALAILEAAYGPNHPTVAGALDNLGTVLASRDQFEEAISLHERALRISEATLGRDHPDVAINLHNLAADLARRDRDLAIVYARRAVAAAERTLGPDHAQTALFRKQLDSFVDRD